MSSSFFSRFIDVLAPASCPICGNRLSADERFLCAGCLLPLPFTGFAANPGDNPIAETLRWHFPVEKCASLLSYRPGSAISKLLLSLKFFNHPEYGTELGRIMASEFQSAGFFDGITTLFPLPLTRKRQRQRGYNQSLEICRGISEITGIAITTKGMTRSEGNAPQSSLPHDKRYENVKNVFHLTDPSIFQGQHILIVDDILTTGSTVTACAKEILKAGDVKISIATIGYAGQ